MAKESRPIDLDADSSLLAMVKTVADKTHRSVSKTLAQAENDQLGLPLPSLALAYAIGADIWPLGRLVEVYGEEHSCKTALITELMRWHVVYKGHAVFVENEGKPANRLMGSIFQKENKDAVIHVLSNTMDQWQAELTHWFNVVDQYATGDQPKDSDKPSKKKGAAPGYVRPYFFCVDSLMSTPAQETIDKLDESGSSGRGHPLEALMITRFLSASPARLRGKPWSLVFTNHNKPVKEPGQYVATDRTAGGRAMRFFASLRIRTDMTRRIEGADGSGGRGIKLRFIKSGFGPSHREIYVEFMWRKVQTKNGMAQVSFWDWPAATIFLLESFIKTSKTRWKEIQSIVDLHIVPGRRLWSKRLGISKDAPETYHKAGLLIESDRLLRHELCQFLMISGETKFSPGYDFADKAMHDRLTPRVDELSFELHKPIVDHADFEDLLLGLDKVEAVEPVYGPDDE